jgi:hypothetical protein
MPIPSLSGPLSPDPHAIREQNPHAYAGGMIEFNIPHN